MIQSQIKYVCLVLLFGVIAYTNVTSFLTRDSLVQKAVFEQMLSRKSTTNALLDSTYLLLRSKAPRKLGAVTVDKDYEISYEYRIGGNAYFGTKVFHKLPVKRLLKLYYLESDPYKHSFNPEEDIQKVEDDGVFNVIMGSLFGLLMLYFSFKLVKTFEK